MSGGAVNTTDYFCDYNGNVIGERSQTLEELDGTMIVNAYKEADEVESETMPAPSPYQQKVDDFVDTAKGEVGTPEKVIDKVDNITKYGNPEGDAWCGYFVGWAGGTSGSNPHLC